MSVRSALREMLAKRETVVAPGAYDPFIARVVELLGFKAVYMGGNMTGIHLATTEPLTTLTEQVDAARRVTRTMDLPLVVDADAGFGDAVHTVRCVREFELAGVAAIHIEDQVYPKRSSYHRGLEHVVPRDEFRDKMRFALEARRDPDFVIIGRTDGFRAVGGSMEECITRGKMLAELEVDAIMPLGLRQPQDLKTFRDAVPDIPLVALTGFGGLSVEELENLGYRIIIYPGVPTMAALDGILRVYAELKERGTTTMDSARADELRRIIDEALRFSEHWEIERQTTEKGAGA